MFTAWQCSQDGVNPKDVAELYSAQHESKKKNNTAKSEPRYIFMDKDGNEKTWTGRGRMPKELKDVIDSGGSIEQFLIGTEGSQIKKATKWWLFLFVSDELNESP